MYLQLHKPVIIALVEILPTNLRYPDDENEIALDGYTLYHNLNARGRGIALYVHCSLKVKEVHFPNQDFNECLFGIVQLSQDAIHCWLTFQATRTVYRTTYHNYRIGQISGCLVSTQINAK